MRILYCIKVRFTVLKIGLVVAIVLSLTACDSVKSFAIKALIKNHVKEVIGPIPDYTHKAKKMETTYVTMSDGIKLETRIFLPKGQGPWPTVLVRDPYMFSRYITCEFYVRYGYACVHQDVRGRFGSEGIWYPVVNERNDGIDTLNWLIEQPWQNNNIALMGESYLGLVQWAIADVLPKQVKTMVINVALGEMYDLVYYGGHFRYGLIGAWSSTLFAGLMEQEKAIETWRTEVITSQPAASVNPEIFGEAWDSYQDYLKYPQKSDPFWNTPFYKHMRDSYKSVDIPVMLTGRWYDFFLQGMLDNFEKMPSRSESLFLVGAGDHAHMSFGDLDVKDRSYQSLANTIKWFDHYLKDKPLDNGLKSGYLVYKNGQDTWQHYETWPPAVEMSRLYLTQLPASRQCGGGQLAKVTEPSPAVSYMYDPKRPVPTSGGSAVLSPDYAPTANRYINDTLCSRSDVLSFNSDVFKTQTRIAGGVDIRLQLATDVEDTAFSVQLSEVFADGRVMNIRNDITSLLMRNNSDTELSYRPGQKLELMFDLTVIDWTLQAGSRLRLNISSSDYPAYHAHPNIKGLWSEVDSTVIANQTLYSGFVDLPIVPVY